MTTRSRMVHRACVERATAGVDGYGNALPVEWVTHIASLPAYYWQLKTGGERIGEINAISYTQQLLVPWSTDIHESDRINGIKGRLGDYLTEEVFNVIAIVFRPDHLLITMVVVR